MPDPSNTKLLDRWFGSDVWREIVDEAEAGDEDSMWMMEHVSMHLASLTFHLNNESGDARIEYELSFFEELCDDFEVA